MRDASSALDLFCGVALGPPLYLETRFLLIVRALEVYHRKIPGFTQRLMPRAEFGLRRTALLEAVKHDPGLFRVDPRAVADLRQRTFAA